MVSSYVLVSTDVNDKLIKDGPLLWDAVASVALPVNRQLITEAAALAAGYAYPAPSASDVNTGTLEQRAATAIANNVNYLAVTAPTNAQVVAQVARLTRQSTGVIRLLLNQTDTTSGT